MPVGKRRIDNFDPNKSDSDDENFELDNSRPRKKSKKSRSPKKKPAKGRRRAKGYGGSDISDDNDVSESSLDNPYSSEEVESEPEINEMTGRRVRSTKRGVTYKESEDGSDDDLKTSTSEEDDIVASTPKKPRQQPQRQQHIVKLKVNTATAAAAVPAHTTRAGSTTRTTRRTSNTPATTTRRTRRGTSEDPVEEFVALSTSGRHAEVIRQGSHSPKTAGRRTRGAKGLKAPVSMIKEEIENSSADQNTEDAVMDAAEEPTEVIPENEMSPRSIPNTQNTAPEDDEDMADADNDAEDAAAPAPAEAAEEEEDDDEDIPVRRTRGSRADPAPVAAEEPAEEPAATEQPTGRRLRNRKSERNTQDASSDFEPPEESAEEDVSASEASPTKATGEDDSSSGALGRGRRGKSTRARSARRGVSASASEDEVDREEVGEELMELKGSRKRRPQRRDPDILYEGPKSRRERKPVDYSIKPMDQIYAADEEGEDAAPTPTKRGKGARGGASQPWERNLYTTYGPFGGAGGPAPVIGGPWGTGAIGGVDSDSSDDEGGMHRGSIAGNVGMTPSTAMPAGLLPGLGQTHNADTAVSGTPANHGKVKSAKALADADPLGVDQNVDFSKVGGLEGHIDQLKEMVQMPLLYPELFMKFHVTPPRGVLFHGPPGTGKTLLARALAASVGTGGRKITFYMRKGADALSKWVGEAERQLRLLFEEARKTQPSIIFFDEIDGLAPVRSSKQEQIHASIVSTLLALMDGMDGRGQVIVIGATNRPDNIDPALRRPGRFDREFYFPLPDTVARLNIINIHTKDWGIDDNFKTSLADVTKGYGGADLRALCTEAALNAMQRTYPQIYSSTEKLIVDPDKIKITAKDFMISVKKIVPSSERATASGAAPLPKSIEPLLRAQLKDLENIVDSLIPIKKKVTALQEAMFEQYDDDDHGFSRETMQQEFENSRVYRPRLLIAGASGMGQQYLGAAILNHFEGLHVQSFDLPTIYSDSSRSAEAAIVQLFSEVKRHKPSVIYLPGVDTWYHTLSDTVITTFLGLLKSIKSTDPVMVLGVSDTEPEKMDQDLLRELFGFSKRDRYTILRPTKEMREEFFSGLVTYIRKNPKDFPDPVNRKKRKLEQLQIAPPPPPREPTREEIKALKKRDHQTLNLLKVHLQPIMDQINRKYRKFRTPVIPQNIIQYLYDEQDPHFVRPDISQFRPFELDKDKDGTTGLRETASGKFFYNLETTTIEERLSNGFYARPQDFLADIRSLAKDARNIGDKDRTLKANELLTNAEVDVDTVEKNPLLADCENVYQRQLQRAKEKEEKHRKRAELERLSLVRSNIPTAAQKVSLESQTPGPLTLGEAIPGSSKNPGPLNTPFQTPASNGSATGAEQQRLSNGSEPSGHSGGDSQMGGTDDGNSHQHHTPSNSQSQSMQPPASQWPRMPQNQSNISAYATGNNTQLTQQSQRSAFQPISQDMSPSALINDASTTTSGKKTGSSEGWSLNANGKREGSPTDSMMPDTQFGNSQSQSQSQLHSTEDSSWLHSQVHGLGRGQHGPVAQSPSTNSQHSSQNPPIPPFNAATKPAQLANILNSPIVGPSVPSSSQGSSDKDFIVTEETLDKLLPKLVTRTSGCTVEQMEQVNRELMDTVWRLRGEWNRDWVAMEVIRVFNECIDDIEEMQKIALGSQPQESQTSST